MVNFFCLMRRIRATHHEGHEGHEAGNILQGEAPSMVSMLSMVKPALCF